MAHASPRAAALEGSVRASCSSAQTGVQYSLGGRGIPNTCSPSPRPKQFWWLVNHRPSDSEPNPLISAGSYPTVSASCSITEQDRL